MPEVVAELHRLGIEPTTMSRADFNQRYHDDLKLWKDVVTKAGIPLAD